jgi:simple sugar transport system permease protein
MAVEQPAPAGRDAALSARPSRAQGAWSRVRPLLLGRPETGAVLGTLIFFGYFALTDLTNRSLPGIDPADHFLERPALAGVMNIAAELGIVAMAVTLLMIAGHFDLSVGSVLGFSSMLVPYLMVNHETASGLAIAIAFACAMGMGLVNAAIVIVTRIPSFIVTLGFLLIWRGVANGVSGGFPVLVPRDDPIFDAFSHRVDSGPFAQYNVSALWFLAGVLVLTFVLLRTKFGNWTFAVGGNERAARSMGVPVDRVWLLLFVLTATSACLAGIIQVGRFNSVEPTRGTLLELDAIAAAVIGGARLNGGYGSIVGTAFGCLLVATIRVALPLSGIGDYWLNIVIGGLIILAVVVNTLLGRSRPQV